MVTYTKPQERKKERKKGRKKEGKKERNRESYNIIAKLVLKKYT